MTKVFHSEGLMELTDYRLERAALGEGWDAQVERSRHGTIFALTPFLAGLSGRPAAWYCLKNREVRAAVLVIESDDGRSAIYNDLVVHGGVMGMPPDPKQSVAQIHDEEFRTTCAVVQGLSDHYAEVFLSFAPEFTDLRPVQWYNYGLGGRAYETAVRYTSRVSIEGLAETGDPTASAIYARATKSRRQEIRYGRREGIATERGYEPDLFEHLYRRTFARQGSAVDEALLRDVARVIRSLHEAGRLRMYLSRSEDREVRSVALFGLDAKRAYYLFGANDPDMAGGRTGTMVLWDAFIDLAREGVGEVDLEGINSPHRGYFKTSFGGSITPYYQAWLGQGPGH